MDGVRLNDFDSLQALGVDRQKLVEEITRAYAHQIYVDGFFNGDPHPGKYRPWSFPCCPVYYLITCIANLLWMQL